MRRFSVISSGMYVPEMASETMLAMTTARKKLSKSQSFSMRPQQAFMGAGGAGKRL